MGYPTKVQLISRTKGTDQWYINFPTPIAEAMDFKKGEVINWHVKDRSTLVLHRPDVPTLPVKVRGKKNG